MLDRPHLKKKIAEKLAALLRVGLPILASCLVLCDPPDLSKHLSLQALI